MQPHTPIGVVVLHDVMVLQHDLLYLVDHIVALLARSSLEGFIEVHTVELVVFPQVFEVTVILRRLLTHRLRLFILNPLLRLLVPRLTRLDGHEITRVNEVDDAIGFNAAPFHAPKSKLYFLRLNRYIIIIGQI